jgi:hypothetical protein
MLEGVLLLVFRSVQAEIVKVSPQEWKGKLGLVGEPKRASVDLARELYPESGIKEHNMADALLIAHYAIREFKFNRRLNWES